MTHAVEAPARGAEQSAEAFRLEAAPAARAHWPHWAAAGVLVTGLLLTAALTIVFSVTYSHNEKRLLGLRAREIGAVLTSAVPGIQTPLASATALADETGGDPARFRKLVKPYVGTQAGQPFVSAALWRVTDYQRGPVVVVGSQPVLKPFNPRTGPFLKRAQSESTLAVIGLIMSSPPRIGYSYTGRLNGQYVAYGEAAIPPSRRSPIQRSSPFSDLNYAIYLGPRANQARLLLTSVAHPPLQGRTGTAVIAFGDRSLRIVVAARQSLSGSLPQHLPLALLLAGLLLTAGATLLTGRLSTGRRHAEQLAGRLEQIAEENHRLFAEQRSIAQTLQQALLPEELPELPGIEAAARYEPGVRGVDIGGDWYDVIRLDDRRLLLVVGDVSGRGLRAATTMAALRYAIHAYAAEGDLPATFLPKLSQLVNVNVSGQLATVLCAVVDVEARELSVTSAGHLPPLLISSRGSDYVRPHVGTPVGVDPHATYTATTVPVPRGATFLAFTDGLVERRGEPIDAGLDRLRRAAGTGAVTLDETLTKVTVGVRHEHFEDDTAILGIRWLT